MIISLNLETDFSHTAKRGKPTNFFSETLLAGFISAETELLSYPQNLSRFMSALHFVGGTLELKLPFLPDLQLCLLYTSPSPRD